MYWQLGCYLVALALFAAFDVWKRKSLKKKLFAEYEKDLRAAHADYQKEVDAFKATIQAQRDQAFADGATMACHAVVDALKEMDYLDSGLEVEIASITRNAMKKAKDEQQSKDEAFLRSMKIKP